MDTSFGQDASVESGLYVAGSFSSNDGDGVVTTQLPYQVTDTSQYYDWYKHGVAKILIATDGKIVIGGSSNFGYPYYQNALLIRYNTNGSLDNTFVPSIPDTDKIYTPQVGGPLANGVIAINFGIDINDSSDDEHFYLTDIEFDTFGDIVMLGNYGTLSGPIDISNSKSFLAKYKHHIHLIYQIHCQDLPPCLPLCAYCLTNRFPFPMHASCYYQYH